MKIDGDMILYKNAVEIATQYIQENNEEKIFIYNFGLLDWLLKAPICGCSVFRRSLFLKYPYSNKLKNDYYVSRKLMRIGYVRERPYMKGIIIGNHCDDPNEFQVFRRCYTQGVKWGKRYMLRKLTEQYNKTGNELYDVAIKALWFGTNKGIYPTSHNLDFDRQMFEEFKNENNNSPVA